MARMDFFNDIQSVIDDWKDTTFTFVPKNSVPGIDDSSLTYGNGEEKKGVELSTCVLYVDIRDSVKLSLEKHAKTMGKIYSVFAHCVLLAADYEGGFVRNIIGDRVMVVFPPDNCFTKAVNCAITINHIAKEINKKFTDIEFKCGIGVDYGKLSVMKVGILKKGVENDDNKGLVWVGRPANLASRLTDCANKRISDVVYCVDAEFYEYHPFGGPYFSRATGWYNKKKEFTAEELASSLESSKYNSELSSKSFRHTRSIERRVKTYEYKPILITDTVYQKYAKLNSERKDVKSNLWTKESRKINDVELDVWGADLYWVLNK